MTLDNITGKLIEKCKRKERKAQHLLYMLSKDKLKLLAWRYCPNVHDVQDILQNAYLKIFNSIDRFDSNKGEFEAWSAKIVINEALLLLKKKRQIPVEYFDETPLMITDKIDFNQYSINEIKTAVKQMKIPQRVIFNMYFFDGYSYAEIAEFLNIKESSARANVSRAKKAFMEIWEKTDNSIAL